jgi:hypothetical protein
MLRQYPGLGPVTFWAIGIASAIILFASILVHELSHFYVAKKNRLPIGNGSSMSCRPHSAQKVRLRVRHG